MIRALVVLLLLIAPARAHDEWIGRGGHRNQAGEWCCGEGDCFVIPGQYVRVTPRGYALYTGTAHAGEVVPFAEAQTSPDGAYWRCKRPDGSRRCFFAPIPIN